MVFIIHFLMVNFYSLIEKIINSVYMFLREILITRIIWYSITHWDLWFIQLIILVNISRAGRKLSIIWSKWFFIHLNLILCRLFSPGSCRIREISFFFYQMWKFLYLLHYFTTINSFLNLLIIVISQFILINLLFARLFLIIWIRMFDILLIIRVSLKSILEYALKTIAIVLKSVFIMIFVIMRMFLV